MRLAMTVILLTTATAMGGTNSKRILDVKARVEFVGDRLRLQDVIRNPQRLRQQERNLQIGEQGAFAKGGEVRLVELAYLLQDHRELQDIRLRGPQWITVRPGAHAERVRLAKTHIRDALQRQHPWQQWQLDLRFTLTDERQMSAMDAFDRVEVHPTSTRQVLGPTPLHIAFYDGDRLLNTRQMAPIILREVQAFTLRGHGKAGSILTTDDLQETTLWVGATANEYLEDPADIIGRELGRRVKAGEVLTARHLIEPVFAKRGERVWVTSTRNGLSIRLPAIAKRSGRQGETIQLINERSQKVFRARLVGLRQAIIQ